MFSFHIYRHSKLISIINIHILISSSGFFQLHWSVSSPVSLAGDVQAAALNFTGPKQLT